jgi:hypothetical protein
MRNAMDLGQQNSGVHSFGIDRPRFWSVVGWHSTHDMVEVIILVGWYTTFGMRGYVCTRIWRYRYYGMNRGEKYETPLWHENYRAKPEICCLSVLIRFTRDSYMWRALHLHSSNEQECLDEARFHCTERASSTPDSFKGGETKRSHRTRHEVANPKNKRDEQNTLQPILIWS